MSGISGGRDPYLLRGLTVMAGGAALYLTIDEPVPVTTGVFAALFVVGAIIAVGSPTRWSVRTTLRLYQAVPLLVGVSTVTMGGHFLLAADVPVLSALLLGWGILSLVALFVWPWDDVESHLERLNAPGTEADRPAAPLPHRLFLRLRFAGIGLLTVTAAVLAARLVVRPDVGHLAVLAGVGGAGLMHVLCSPYSGPPERVVRLRQARWAVLGTGIAVSSLYGVVVVDVTMAAAFWGAVTIAVAYWAAVRVSWDDVRDAIAAAQSRADHAGD